jgi:hypothetical protein
MSKQGKLEKSFELMPNLTDLPTCHTQTQLADWSLRHSKILGEAKAEILEALNKRTWYLDDAAGSFMDEEVVRKVIKKWFGEP